MDPSSCSICNFWCASVTTGRETSAVLCCSTKKPSGLSLVPHGFPWWLLFWHRHYATSLQWLTDSKLPKWGYYYSGNSQNSHFRPAPLFPTIQPSCGAGAASPAWPPPHLDSEEGKRLKAGCARGKAEQWGMFPSLNASVMPMICMQMLSRGLLGGGGWIPQGSSKKQQGPQVQTPTEPSVLSNTCSVSIAHGLPNIYGSEKVGSMAELLFWVHTTAKEWAGEDNQTSVSSQRRSPWANQQVVCTWSSVPVTECGSRAIRCTLVCTQTSVHT